MENSMSRMGLGGRLPDQVHLTHLRDSVGCIAEFLFGEKFVEDSTGIDKTDEHDVTGISSENKTSMMRGFTSRSALPSTRG